MMKVCPNCNHEQESGKFCGKCGTALPEATSSVSEEMITGQQEQEVQEVREDQPSETDAPPSETKNNPAEQELENVQPASSANTGNQSGGDAQAAAAATRTEHSGVSAEAIKTGLSNYGSYLLDLLKQPTKAFKMSNTHFTYALITVILYAITASLSIYFLTKSLMDSMMGFFGAGSMSGSLFFPLNSRLVFIFALAIAISFLSIFAMMKVLKHPISVKLLFTQYGSLAVPFLAINIIAILAGFTGAATTTLLLLAASMSLYLFILPVITVYEKGNRHHQRIYLAIGTILLIALINYIIGQVMLEDFLSNLEDLIDDIMYYGF